MNPGRQLTPNRCRFSALAAICLLGINTAASAQGTREPDLESQVKVLCQSYLADFASAKTHLAYGRKINGPKGTAVLVPTAEVRQGLVRGQPVPYGYGSGIEDLALHNGHLLFALCDAYEATKNAYFAETARRAFSGLKLLGSTSPVPGFVPRGPHPDDLKAYYADSSLDQHTTFVYALWRYFRSELATPDDKAFIRQALASVGQRLEKNGWAIRVEDDSRIAHVGFSWLQATDVGAGTLLTVLAAIHDVTGDKHWLALYEKFGTERDGIRWKVLDAGGGKRRPLTLYWNQFSVRDAVLSRIEKNPQRQAILARRWGEVTTRMLQSNVWEAWRRADWAPGDVSGSVEVADEEAEKRLGTIGLSLKQPATVFDLWEFYRKLAPQDRAQYWVQRLCVRMPMGSLHAALLSGQREAVDKAVPRVREMLKELDFKHVDSGETYYLAVVLGLHLVALEASEVTATWQYVPLRTAEQKAKETRNTQWCVVMGEYEIRVLDNFGDAEVGMKDLGGIYGLAAPSVNACKAPRQWQKYVIEYRAPKFDAQGNKTANARIVKVAINDKVIHENVELPHALNGGLSTDGKNIRGQEVPQGPILLRGNHGPVAYRNIRVKPLSAKGGADR